jgi:hypothetical protein
MRITVIAIVVVAVFTLGMKLRRGSFFIWSGKNNPEYTRSVGRDGDDAIK